MFSRIFGLHLLQKSRKMSKILLSQNQIEIIPSHRSRREISYGANGSKNKHLMKKLFSSKVFIRQTNIVGIVPRGNSRVRRVDYTESLLTVQK